MNFILLLIISCVYSQHFIYDEEDWFTVSSPGMITSITATNDEVLFSSENGVYACNKYNFELVFIEDYVRKFNSKSYHMIHYDKYRDYVWLLKEDNLCFRPYLSTFWREIDFYEIELNSHNDIINIGSNADYLFINIGSNIIVLNPYTGNLITDGIDNIDNIIWTSTSRNLLTHNFDLTTFHSFEGYSFISNQQIEYNGRFLHVTSITKDDSYLWIGTDSGEIFLCDINLRSVDKIESMPLFSNIKFSYIDNQDEWWLSTSDFIMSYNDILLDNDQIFVIRWIEEENKWISYNQKKYLNIRSNDITAFLRLENTLYVGTYYGLLIFDINREKWSLINTGDGLESDRIYDLEYYNNNVYISTNQGINVLSTIGNIIVKDIDFERLNRVWAKDIHIDQDNFLILLENGIIRYIPSQGEFESVIEGYFEDFSIDDDSNIIVSKRNKIFKFDPIKNEKELIKHIKNIKNISLCNNYLWVNSSKKAILLNLNSNEEFEYDNDDGISGSIINHLDCDNDWVWFSSDKGLTFYNWGRYYK